MEPKPWWSSKINWLAIGNGLVGVWELVKDGEITQADFQAIVMIGSAVLFVIFRAFTKAPIANKLI